MYLDPSYKMDLNMFYCFEKENYGLIPKIYSKSKAEVSPLLIHLVILFVFLLFLLLLLF